MKKYISLLLCMFLLFAFTGTSFAETGEEAPHSKQLIAIAKNTYRYFEDFTDPQTGLTWDSVRYENGFSKQEQTSPTNIGIYLMSTISAEKMGIISKDEAVSKIKKTLTTLEKMDKWNGLFFNWYHSNDGSVMKEWGQFISTVDNGWLSAGLITVGQAYPSLYEETNKLVRAMDYSKLYDPAIGQMFGGYDAAAGKLTDFHFGMFYTEPRVASYIAIGKNDVPEDHWWKMFRTLPRDWDWQGQIPEGQIVNHDGVDVFEGHYSYKGINYVPSWGGSMFEALMPTLVLKEKELGKNALGLNDKQHVDLQIAFAKEKGYPVWGMSPCAIPNSYTEFGAFPLGTAGYKDQGIVTPHASFLALEFEPEEAFQNILNLKDLNTYGKYGFYDSVNVKTGEVTKAYLALDQGMIMVSLGNYVKDGVVRNYFANDEIGKKPEHLLSEETFSIK